jgi:glutathione S-transferase
MYEGTYTLIGQEMSMFTRKLEAQLRYQQIPYQWEIKSQEKAEAINARVGTNFIPALKTPDGWMINDTISIGPFLHDRFNDCPVIPDTAAQRGSCYILEDFFNHWYPRQALHSRWCYPENVIITGQRFGCNILLGKHIDADLTDEEKAQIEKFGEVMLNSFGAAACEIQGAGPETTDAMKADFARLLELLVAHFKDHDFLLGKRACLADFALAGPFVAHFLLDPEPKSWLGAHLQVFEDYIERVWSGARPDAQWPDHDQLPESLAPIFDYIIKNYHAFAGASIAAAGRGEKFFELDLGDGSFRARSMKRLEKARLHVQDELLRANCSSTKIADSGIMSFYMAESSLNKQAG